MIQSWVQEETCWRGTTFETFSALPGLEVWGVVNLGRTVVELVGSDSGFDSAYWSCGTAALERLSDAKTIVAQGGV